MVPLEIADWAQNAVAGSMPVALPVALLAGLVSFFSPCVVPLLPGYLDPDWVRQSREALKCKPTQDLIASFEAPMSFSRFRNNIRQSFAFNSYRINRVPLYELQRCRLPIPPPVFDR